MEPKLNEIEAEYEKDCENTAEDYGLMESELGLFLDQVANLEKSWLIGVLGIS